MLFRAVPHAVGYLIVGPSGEALPDVGHSSAIFARIGNDVYTFAPDTYSQMKSCYRVAGFVIRGSPKLLLLFGHAFHWNHLRLVLGLVAAREVEAFRRVFRLALGQQEKRPSGTLQEACSTS
jgi:hypothetical protein